MTYHQKRRRQHQLFLPQTPKKENARFNRMEALKLDPCRYCANLQDYGNEGSMRCWVQHETPEKPEDKLTTCFAPMDGVLTPQKQIKGV